MLDGESSVAARCQETSRIRGAAELTAPPECAAWRDRRHHSSSPCPPVWLGRSKTVARLRLRRRSFFQGQIDPEKSVLLLGGRTFHIHVSGQPHLAFKRSIIDLQRQNLRSLIARFRRFTRAPDDNPARLDREINQRFVHTCEVNTDAYRCGTAIRVDWRLPKVRRAMPALNAAHAQIRVGVT